MNILQINASARREGANSTRLATRVVERLQAAHPGARVTVRDLAVTPLDGVAGVARGGADRQRVVVVVDAGRRGARHGRRGNLRKSGLRFSR